MKKNIFLLIAFLTLLFVTSCSFGKTYTLSVNFNSNCTVEENNIVNIKNGSVFTIPQAKIVDAEGNKYQVSTTATLVDYETKQKVTDAYIQINYGDEYLLTYHVTDMSVNVQDVVYHIVCLDHNAPVLTVENEFEEMYAIGSTLKLIATSIDEGTTNCNVTYKVNYSLIKSSKGNSISLTNGDTINFSREGYYHILITSSDESGNTSTFEKTIYATKNAISLNGNNIIAYSLVSKNGNSWENEAKSIVNTYFSKVKTTYPSTTGSGKQIIFECNDDANFDEEYYEISIDANLNITIYGGVRGINYAAFELLERLGFGFYSLNLKTVPTEYTVIKASDLICHSTSGFKYRSILGQTAGNNWGDMLMFRLNSLWQRTDVPYAAYGGTYYYAGTQAHTLTGETKCLLADYTVSNPEYFALVDDTRRTDRLGQMCLTNQDAMDAVVLKIKEWLKASPNASLVSVTLGDNHNYCECATCQAKYDEGYQISDLYMAVVDYVAKAIESEYPKVMVQAFSYGGTAGVPTKISKVNDNIILQYCVGCCKAHALTDETCEVNCAARETIEQWTTICSNLMVWDYPNNFKYQLASTPQIKDFLSNAKYFYDLGAWGMFEEYIHTNVNGCCFDELKTYLLTKVMWNPNMTTQEYQGYIDDFVNAYYGEGGSYLVDYINLYESYAGRAGLHYEYDMLKFEDNTEAVSSLIPADKIQSFLTEANRLWDLAEQYATEDQLERIKKDRVQLMYLELCLTMDDILANGSQDEKIAVVAKNAALIQAIKDYNLKYTFWGDTAANQNAKLDENVSPLNWNYKW